MGAGEIQSDESTKGTKEVCQKKYGGVLSLKISFVVSCRIGVDVALEIQSYVSTKQTKEVGPRKYGFFR